MNRLAQFADASLPSSAAASDLLEGKPGALGAVVGTSVLRALLIAGGMRAAGIKRPRTLVRGSIGGALAIEAFVLGWIAYKRKKA